MNTYSQALYRVKKTKSGSDEISQGQPNRHRLQEIADSEMIAGLIESALIM